jgi:hypothetical protein
MDQRWLALLVISAEELALISLKFRLVIDGKQRGWLDKNSRRRPHRTIKASAQQNSSAGSE